MNKFYDVNIIKMQISNSLRTTRFQNNFIRYAYSQKIEKPNNSSKHTRKPKGQSRMNNLETLTTLGTQDTEE